MTDEEKAEEYYLNNHCCSAIDWCKAVCNIDCPRTRGYLDGLAEGRKGKNYFNKFVQKCKENEELKKEISVLLSCANCQENKGGYVCEKEYNDKCLAQKIEYIKELKEEIAELKEKLKSFENGDVAWQGDMDATIKQNLELKAQIQEQQIIAMQRIADKELKIVNLEEQIEKMKCCENCKHYSISAEEVCEDCNFFGIPNAMNDKWEIAE